MKKKLLIIFTIFLLISLVCFAFGCKKRPKEETEIYLIVTIDNDETKKHIIHNDEIFYLTVNTKASTSDYGAFLVLARWARYIDNRICSKKPIFSFHDEKVPISAPGTHVLNEIYEDGQHFTIHLTVVETRDMPEFELIPGDDCKDYVDKRHYQYKYDGEAHVPGINVIDNGNSVFSCEPVYTYQMSSYIQNVKTYYNGEFLLKRELPYGYEQKEFVDVGAYMFDIIIPIEELPIPTRWMYAQIKITIVVEILEH